MHGAVLRTCKDASASTSLCTGCSCAADSSTTGRDMVIRHAVAVLCTRFAVSNKTTYLKPIELRNAG